MDEGSHGPEVDSAIVEESVVEALHPAEVAPVESKPDQKLQSGGSKKKRRNAKKAVVTSQDKDMVVLKPSMDTNIPAAVEVDSLPILENPELPPSSAAGSLERKVDTAARTSAPLTQNQKDILKFEKKLREVDCLKKRASSGEVLEPNQLEKITQEANFFKQAAALRRNTETEPQRESTAQFQEQASVDHPPVHLDDKETGDVSDNASTRSSEDLPPASYKLDWNDPAWESAELPCMRFTSLPENDDEEDEEDYEPIQPQVAEAPHLDATPRDGSYFMPVGFLSDSNEYFPFVEVATQQADLVYAPAVMDPLQPALMDQRVMEPTFFDPLVGNLRCESPCAQEQGDQIFNSWCPESSPDDWGKIGKQRGVSPPSDDWSLKVSHNSWGSEKRGVWPRERRQSTRDQWENGSMRWDQPWGM